MQLWVFVPMDDRDAYARQSPVPIHARVCWQNEAGGHYLFGVEFENMNRQLNGIMEVCFRYFDKAPYYRDNCTHAAQPGYSGIMIDTTGLPAWVQWVAQDRDGTWWGYEAEPHKHHCGWYENEIGCSLRITRTDPDPDWESSLRRINAM